MYNKNEFNETNNKEILHKVKRNWAIVSVAMLSLIGGGVITAHTASANTTTNQNNNSQANITASSSQPKLINNNQNISQSNTQVNNNLMQNTDQLHNQIIMNNLDKSNVSNSTSQEPDNNMTKPNDESTDSLVNDNVQKISSLANDTYILKSEATSKHDNNESLFNSYNLEIQGIDSNAQLNQYNYDNTSSLFNSYSDEASYSNSLATSENNVYESTSNINSAESIMSLAQQDLDSVNSYQENAASEDSKALSYSNKLMTDASYVVTDYAKVKSLDPSLSLPEASTSMPPKLHINTSFISNAFNSMTSANISTQSIASKATSINSSDSNTSLINSYANNIKEIGVDLASQGENYISDEVKLSSNANLPIRSIMTSISSNINKDTSLANYDNNLANGLLKNVKANTNQHQSQNTQYVLIIHYINQHNQQIGVKNVTGAYNTLVNIPDAPNGYHFVSANSPYRLNAHTQNINIRVDGDLANNNQNSVIVHIVERDPNNNLINQESHIVHVQGDIGDSYNINPLKYQPNDFHSMNNPIINGYITYNGTQPNIITFNYMRNAPQMYSKVAQIPIYIDNNLQGALPLVINGYAGKYLTLSNNIGKNINGYSKNVSGSITITANGTLNLSPDAKIQYTKIFTPKSSTNIPSTTPSSASTSDNYPQHTTYPSNSSTGVNTSLPSNHSSNPSNISNKPSTKKNAVASRVKRHKYNESNVINSSDKYSKSANKGRRDYDKKILDHSYAQGLSRMGTNNNFDSNNKLPQTGEINNHVTNKAILLSLISIGAEMSALIIDLHKKHRND